MREEQPTTHSVSDFDLDRSIEQAWASFSERLGEVVSVMDAGATLRVGTLAGDRGEKLAFIAFSCGPDGNLVGTAAVGADADPVWMMSATQEDSGELAAGAVAVLREKFSVPHPAFLAPDQLADVLTPRPTTEQLGGYHPEQLRAVVPESRADLEGLIQTQLTGLIGHSPLRDADGDFGLRVGSAMVFVRVTPDAREVIVFSAIVHDVEGRSRAMEVLSDLNTDARFVRFFLIRDKVFVSLSFFSDPFVPAHLEQALKIVSLISDQIDSQLACKLRGRTTFGEDDHG